MKFSNTISFEGLNRNPTLKPARLSEVSIFKRGRENETYIRSKINDQFEYHNAIGGKIIFKREKIN